VNVAFIGVDSHFSYTKSSFFFIELLREQLGNIAVFSSEWRWIHLPRKRHWDVLVFWQHFPQRWEIDCLDADSIVLVPMFDDCPQDEGFWSTYRDCRILCFCQALADRLRGFGMEVLYVQYFPPVPQESVLWDSPGLKGFFWPRKDEVSWSHVKPLLVGASWETIHIHRTDNLSRVAVDIDEGDVRKFALKVSAWFDSQGQYMELLIQHQVFFAPRRTEGIGLSFLEAMSLGMAVVSADGPTMSEYIRPGINGYLYDPDRPEAPPWQDVRRWGETARKGCIAGRAQWMNSIPVIVEFLVRKGPPRVSRTHDGRRARAILRAWPRFIRFSLLRFFIALRNRFFPKLKRNRVKSGEGA
jgi:hypothetical protein